MNGNNQNNHHRGNWREAWDFCCGTWQRALVTLGILLFLAITGIVTSIIHVILVNVIIPAIVLFVLIWAAMAIFPRGRH